MAKRAQRKSTNKRTEKKTARKENVKGLQRAGPQHTKKPSLSRARFCARRSLHSANLSSRLRFPQCEPKQRFAISVKSNLSEMTCIILAQAICDLVMC
jgi:hypothetical protein